MPYTLLFKILGPLVLVGLVVGGIWGYGHKRFVAGKTEIQVKWDAQVKELRDTADRDMLRRQEANHGVGIDYRKQAAVAESAASAARADADSLRAILASRAENPAPGQSADDPTISRALGECVGEYQAVAADADATSTRLAGLQSYVAKVCLTDDAADATRR